MTKIIGREPAVFYSLLSGVFLALIQLVHVQDPVQGALNALVLAGAGFATAATVAHERVLPALVGLVQAVFAVLLAYGSPVPESTQAGILALIAALAAFVVRQNVVAPVDGDGATTEERQQAAYESGYQSGQDDAVPTFTAATGGSRVGEESGAHGLTEVLPAVDEADNGGAFH